METYIALLRGINVSGQKKVPMADLRMGLTKAGLGEVQTYIQTGNIILKSDSNPHKLKELIEATIKQKFGFDVPTLVLTPAQIMAVINDSPFSGIHLEKSYFVLLYEGPTTSKIEDIQKLAVKDEPFKITSECVYLNPTNGYGRAKFHNNFFEKKLEVKATTRNYKTMLKLLSLCQ
ncbi:DUF1697 domain-containing protein [Aegicerativicinus sediminis]|uniref:DUF1697 domain-containing protein n=1 Tax=Aegicerativicinus sediminis TaxID=2893202 RepID=UPI001E61CD18|nr:DUF1697 domain-containing protein [Aegicerativicinus sediminis]